MLFADYLLYITLTFINDFYRVKKSVKTMLLHVRATLAVTVFIPLGLRNRVTYEIHYVYV